MTILVSRTLLRLTNEYLQLTCPILLYVSIEAIQHNDLSYLGTSPEWSIATIFILLQTYRIYSEEMKSVIGQLFGQTLVMILVICAVAASINIFVGISYAHSPTAAILIFKWGILLASTLIFLYVAGAALYVAEGGKNTKAHRELQK